MNVFEIIGIIILFVMLGIGVGCGSEYAEWLGNYYKDQEEKGNQHDAKK